MRYEGVDVLFFVKRFKVSLLDPRDPSPEGECHMDSGIYMALFSASFGISKNYKSESEPSVP
jgi:hypothetical protein